MADIGSAWAWLWRTSPLAPAWAVLALAGVGAVAASHPIVWARTRLLATWVHEAGHALAAILTGRTVTGMRVERDASGVTHHVGAERGLGRVLTAAAGYPAPALTGAVVLLLAGTGRPHAAVGLLLAVTVALLPLQRSLRAFAASLTLVGALLIVAVWAPTLDTYALAFLAGYLVAASPRTIVELHRVRQQERGLDGQHSDADTLAGLTGIPALMWEGVFLAVSVVTVAAVAWTLLN